MEIFVLIASLEKDIHCNMGYNFLYLKPHELRKKP